MEYRIYQSQDFPALKNDRPRDYNMVYAGDIDSNPATSPHDTPVQVLEDIFALHNMDDRPDAHRIRSLSVTDVVSLLDTDGTETFYMVASVGFERLLSCRVARTADDTTMAGDTITVWPPAGLDGVHLAVTPKGNLSRKHTYNNTFEAPIQDVIAALIETRRIPAQSDGYEKAELVVRHDGVAVFAQPTDAAETDYPGMNIDGADAGNNQIFLANVELPNTDYPDSITSRLYNGYADFESDEPAALMRTRLREPEETARLGKYADEKQAFRKILYVDRDICETRTWGSDTSDEHEYEPPEDATPGQKKD